MKRIFFILAALCILASFSQAVQAQSPTPVKVTKIYSFKNLPEKGALIVNSFTRIKAPTTWYGKTVAIHTYSFTDTVDDVVSAYWYSSPLFEWADGSVEESSAQAENCSKPNDILQVMVTDDTVLGSVCFPELVFWDLSRDSATETRTTTPKPTMAPQPTTTVQPTATTQKTKNTEPTDVPTSTEAPVPQSTPMPITESAKCPDGWTFPVWFAVFVLLFAVIGVFATGMFLYYIALTLWQKHKHSDYEY